MIIVDGRPMPLRRPSRPSSASTTPSAHGSRSRGPRRAIERDLESRKPPHFGRDGSSWPTRPRREPVRVPRPFSGSRPGGYAQIAAAAALGGGKPNGAVIGARPSSVTSRAIRGVQFRAGGFGRMAIVRTFERRCGRGPRPARADPRERWRHTPPARRAGLPVPADCYGSGAPGCSGLASGLTLERRLAHAPYQDQRAPTPPALTAPPDEPRYYFACALIKASPHPSDLP